MMITRTEMPNIVFFEIRNKCNKLLYRYEINTKDDSKSRLVKTSYDDSRKKKRNRHIKRLRDLKYRPSQRTEWTFDYISDDVTELIRNGGWKV